eukprot:CAMPEP_0117580878 /NCGR_PEP_ID=MMETSP0784-20121206/65478_1 /TAXON_ID=39447 /ORGANISM="" /LENGTH=75 /DNA_ID=CAMNT_0005381051 /DNA_START=106 /DNA_END=333 /DNA_ORIENTATION=-
MPSESLQAHRVLAARALVNELSASTTTDDAWSASLSRTAVASSLGSEERDSPSFVRPAWVVLVQSSCAPTAMQAE